MSGKSTQLSQSIWRSFDLNKNRKQNLQKPNPFLQKKGPPFLVVFFRKIKKSKKLENFLFFKDFFQKSLDNLRQL